MAGQPRIIGFVRRRNFRKKRCAEGSSPTQSAGLLLSADGRGPPAVRLRSPLWATLLGMNAHRIGAQEDEAAGAYGRPEYGGAFGGGERASWLQKVKDAIREE